MKQLTLETRTTGELVGKIYHQGEMVDFIFHQGKIIFMDSPVDLPSMAVRMVLDGTGEWFEVGFLSTVELTGTPATGWTDPGEYVSLHLEQTIDLTQWNMGRFIPAPTPTEPGPGGSIWYWSRSTIPRLWRDVMVDLDVTSRRFGKSITELRIFGNLVTLPNYPYNLATDTAQLQADLRANGFPGSVVSLTPEPFEVEIRTHQQAVVGTTINSLGVTQDGNMVTEVSDAIGIPISLPGYPYTMPAAQAALQADLIAAGQSGAVVRLFGDEWTIHIPDRVTILNERRVSVKFEPGDPFPQWGFDGSFEGIQPGDTVDGTSSNVRSTGNGVPLLEADKQFARLGITKGNRYKS